MTKKHFLAVCVSTAPLFTNGCYSLHKKMFVKWKKNKQIVHVEHRGTDGAVYVYKYHVWSFVFPEFGSVPT